jgi:hypothetical protein
VQALLIAALQKINQPSAQGIDDEKVQDAVLMQDGYLLSVPAGASNKWQGREKTVQ